VGAVSRRPEKSPAKAQLDEKGVPIYPTMEAFFAEKEADLAILSSPIHLHCPQTCFALKNGANVLCEKPVSAVVQDALKMLEAEKESGKFVAIGYQWSFTHAIQSLKRDIMDGLFGKPIRFKTLVMWPRKESYYRRADWAGKLKNSSGEWVLDSPINNATAHYLHNCFYVLGPTRETSAEPAEVEGELYRANKIENFDIGALRCRTKNDVEVLFYSTHAVGANVGPLSHYEFEKGDVFYESRSLGFFARFRDGRIKRYGLPDPDYLLKVWQAVESVQTGAPVACGIQASLPHVICVNGLQESVSEIIDVPENSIELTPEDDDRQVAVKELECIFTHSYDQAILPSEHGSYDWFRKGKKIDLTDYHCFPVGPEPK
jgi:predicted dehydrogenase